MFIVITGGDKCGKTTQCGLLASRLREFGSKVYEAKVPDGDTSVGKAIRKILRTMKTEEVDSSDFHERTILEALFVVDRLNTEKLIEKAEAEGKIVVCSRWAESAGAYATVSGFYDRFYDFRHNCEWHKRAVDSSRKPDLLILLDVHVQYDAKSAQDSGSLEAYDLNYEFQRRIREWLRDYPGRCRVDGSKSPEEVAESIWRVVVSKLLQKSTKVSTQTSSCEPGSLK